MSGAEPEIDFHGPFRRFGRRARLGQGLGSSTGIRAWFGRLGVFVFSFLRGFEVVLSWGLASAGRPSSPHVPDPNRGGGGSENAQSGDIEFLSPRFSGWRQHAWRGWGVEGGGVTRGRSGQSSGACPVYVHITFNLGGILRLQWRWLHVGLRGVCRSPVASPAVSLKPK